MPAANRWTTDYLASIISPSFPCDIFASDTTRFQYYDDKKNTTYEKFVKPMWKVTASFQEFSEMLREASEPSRGDEDGKIVENKKYYLQVKFTKNFSKSLFSFIFFSMFLLLLIV